MHSAHEGVFSRVRSQPPERLWFRLRYGALPGLLLSAAFLAMAAAPVAPASAQEKSKVHTVLIDGMKFSPQTLEVNAGDTVVWRNKDPYPHTATAENKAFDSRDIPENGTWKYEAKAKGTMPYFCKLHTTMKGVLVVK
jgi:plastocyanin